MTIGSAYFVYISEVLCGSAMGMAVFIQLCSLLTITFISPMVIATFQIDTIFYTLSFCFFDPQNSQARHDIDAKSISSIQYSLYDPRNPQSVLEPSQMDLDLESVEDRSV